MSVRQSIFWTAIQFVLLMMIELASLAVLARLLTPADMGAYALAFAIVRFLQFVGNFGMFAVIVRTATLEPDDLARILAVALAAAGGTMVISFGVVQLDFARPFSGETSHLLNIMIPTVLPGTLGMIATALLTRQLRFRMISALRICAAIAFPTAAIPLALGGHGAASLASGYAASTLSYALLALLATAGAFFRWPRYRGSAQYVPFASTLFAASAITEAAEAAMTNIIGRLLGLGTLGLFSRARELVLRANLALTDTVMPALTPHLFAAHREDLRGSFLAGLANMTAVSFSIAALLSLTAPLIVPLLLGQQWIDAIPVLGILAIGLAFTPALGLSNLFLIAVHEERTLLYQALVYGMALLVVGIVAIWAGILGAAIILVAIQLLTAAISMAIASRALVINLGALAKAMAPSTIMVPLTILLPVLARQSGVLTGIPPIAELMAAAAAGSAGWLTGIVLTGHPLRAELRRALVIVRGALQPRR